MALHMMSQCQMAEHRNRYYPCTKGMNVKRKKIAAPPVTKVNRGPNE